MKVIMKGVLSALVINAVLQRYFGGSKISNYVLLLTY